MNPRREPLSEIPSPDWYNHDPVMSGLLESVSWITPVLEGFFMRTVIEAMKHRELDPELARRCRAFIAEEANHSRMHKRFNDALGRLYRRRRPPGVRWIAGVLGWIQRHQSLRRRLLLAAALEHFAAVLSHEYIAHTGRLPMSSAYASEMFALHAREELGHCSVVFDLWRVHASAGPAARFLVMLGILVFGGLYTAISLPWILRRKPRRSGWAGLFRARRRPGIQLPWRALFAFAARGFHPDHMFPPSKVAAKRAA